MSFSFHFGRCLQGSGDNVHAFSAIYHSTDNTALLHTVALCLTVTLKACVCLICLPRKALQGDNRLLDDRAVFSITDEGTFSILVNVVVG